MSHEDVAAVWSVLCGRQDVDNVLREVIGSHFLNVSIARRDSSKLREAYVSHVVALRVIFDLQRTYLQSSPRSTESTSSALPPDLLFSAVLHLLDVVVMGCITCSDLSNEGPYNRLTAHAALAGLRTLLLRQKSLTALEYDTLNSRFEEIYERGHWHGTKYTLMLRLCRQAIQKLASSTLEGRYAEPACCTASLPDFFSGLYFFQGYEKSITDASRNLESISLQSLTWFSDCLAFYDLFWSTTAALNQLCMVRRFMPGPANVPLHATEKAEELRNLRLVLSTRYQLRKHAYQSSEVAQGNWVAEQLSGLMLQDLRPDCAEELCQCFEEDSSIIQEMRLQHGMQSSPLQVSDKDFSESLFHSDVSRALQRLHQVLEKRSLNSMKPQNQLAVPKLRSQGGALSTSDRTKPTPFKRAATLPSNAVPRSEQSKSQPRPPLPHSFSIPTANDSISTPSTSDFLPIQPTAALTTGNTDTTIPHRQPSDPSSYTSISNPETNAGSEVFSLRSPQLSSVDEDPPPLPASRVNPENLPEVHPGTLVDPPLLDRPPLSTATESLPEVYRPSSKDRIPYTERSQTWQPDRDNHPEVAAPRSLSTAATTAAPSIMSRESDGSDSIYRTETTYTKPKRWQGLFGASKTGASSSPPSFAFFASGTSLLLWNEVGAGHYDLKDTELPQFQRINASGVCLAAGGKKRCAVVVKGVSVSTRSWEVVSNNTESGQEYRIEVYGGSCDVPVRDWKMESQPHAIAVSRNDNLIAAKFSKTVRIFEVESGNVFQHTLPKPKSRAGRGNHLVTFSTDSLSFVATTRYEPEKVVTYRSECNNASKATVVESSAPTGFPGDNGLSTLICSSSNAQAAFLTTFTEKASPAFLSLKGPKPFARPVLDPKGRIGTRIHHAALCPMGVNLVLLNQRNDLFWIEDCWAGIKEPRRVGTVKRSVAVMKEVEIGMPNSDEVHLFWVDKGKGVLVTMGKGGGKAKPIELIVNLEMLLG